MAEKVKRDWTRVAFGEVVRQVRDQVDPHTSGLERYIAGEHMDTDDLKIRRWGTIGDGYLGPAFHMRFKPGHVLYGSRRTYLRKVAVAEFEGVTANTTFVLEPKDPKVLLPEFLPFIMQTQSFHEHSIKQSKGSVNPYINFSDIAWYEFVLPPLEEQKQLAQIFQAIDNAAEAQKELFGICRKTALTIFTESVARCGLRPIPLGSFLLDGPRNGCSALESPKLTGHWVLSLSALTPWGYRRGQLKAVVKTDAMVAAILRKGDLLISRSNTRELVGLAGIFDEDRSDVSWPDTIMRLRPDPTRLRSRFLELYLRCPTGRLQIQSFAAGTSASMKKINGVNLRKLQIPVPKLDVQDLILSKTEPLEASSGTIVRRLKDLSDVREQLMYRLSHNGALEGA